MPQPARLPAEGSGPTGSVLRFLTCGSVDDGKSTLIGRLLHDTRQILADQLAAVAQASRRRGLDAPDLSLLTDGLEAEREQGITIDVAYRYFATARRKFIIADTPGHEQYTRNMVTGASTADAAVVLADARKGLLTQGRRHLYLAHLLGIRDIVVAVNKMDLAGFAQARFAEACGEFERYAAPLGIDRLRIVPVSALAGDMVVERGDRMPWYGGPTLLETLEAMAPARDAVSLPFRLPVQLVQRVDGERRYLGRVASGRVAPGDAVLVLPSGRATRVAAVRRASGGGAATAEAGDAVALSLADELDVGRGDLLAHPEGAPRPSHALEADLVWMDETPLDLGGRYLLRHGTRTVRARLAAVDGRLDVNTLAWRPASAGLALNEIGRVSLALALPVAADAYATDRATGSFVLVDEQSHRTAGAGMVR